MEAMPPTQTRIRLSKVLPHREKAILVYAFDNSEIQVPLDRDLPMEKYPKEILLLVK